GRRPRRQRLETGPRPGCGTGAGHPRAGAAGSAGGPVAGGRPGGFRPVAPRGAQAPRRFYRGLRRRPGGAGGSGPAGCQRILYFGVRAMISLCVVLALALDALLGEPRRWHPLVGFGHLVTRVEAVLRRDGHSPRRQIAAGFVGWLLLAALPALLLWWLLTGLGGSPLVAVEVLILYLCIGNRSLAEHARAVARPLLAGDLPAARRAVAMIVSRDTAALDVSGATRATVESVLENGSDAVFAPLLWFAVGGAPAALLHRLANTLDARWGYRS